MNRYTLILLIAASLPIGGCGSVPSPATTQTAIEAAVEVAPVKVTTCGDRTSLTKKSTGSGC